MNSKLVITSEYIMVSHHSADKCTCGGKLEIGDYRLLNNHRSMMSLKCPRCGANYVAAFAKRHSRSKSLVFDVCTRFVPRTQAQKTSLKPF